MIRIGSLMSATWSMLVCGIFWGLATTAHAAADDLGELLRETDRALGRESGGSGDAAPNAKRAAAAEESTRTKRAPRASDASSHIGSGVGSSVGSKAKGVTPSRSDIQQGSAPLTPTDAESVQELIGVGMRREAQIKPEDRGRHLALAAGVARLNGRYELSKDDDFFRAQSGERLSGAFLAYDMDLGAVPVNLGSSMTLVTVARLGAGYLRGTVAVDRRGVQNKTLQADYTLISGHGGVGLRLTMARRWHLALVTGPVAGMLVQTGEGHTDSTSGFHWSDQHHLGVEADLFSGLRLGLGWLSQGRLRLASGGHDMFAVSVSLPLAG